MQEPASDTLNLLTVGGSGRLNGEQLSLRYIPLSAARQWDRNPKKHDLQALTESIKTHGFRDPPSYDIQLDAFVEGNGRTEALQWMASHGEDCPRGIAIDVQTGEWCMPVLFGVDARSRLAAERYGIDHNNLTMAGGDFTALDMAKVWTPAYIDILKDLGQAKLLPVSVDGDDLDTLIADALAAEEPSDDPSDGSLLSLTNVTIDQPRYAVEAGDVWEVGGHILVCIDVLTGWPLWAPYLEGDRTIFIPYAGPYALLTIKAEKYRMVLVQPDTYIAGHILDRYEEIHGADSIAKA